MTTLSLEMLRCVHAIKGDGGTIYRFGGGYWAHQRWGEIGGRSFGASTVHALVTRNVLVYDEWKGRKHGKPFPVRASLVKGGHP